MTLNENREQDYFVTFSDDDGSSDVRVFAPSVEEAVNRGASESEWSLERIRESGVTVTPADRPEDIVPDAAKYLDIA